MQGIKNFFNSLIDPKTEDFVNKGWLTPEQFIEAGNQLVTSGWVWKKTPSGQQPQVEPADSQKHFLEAFAVSNERIQDFTSSQGKAVLGENGFQIYDYPETKKSSEQAIESRNYTMTITYDRKYHCPRLWIQGSKESSGQPLKPQEIFQDIMSEYQNETVTVEKHPFLGFQQVTIHPCNHSTTMKSFIDKAAENGVLLKPHQALFIFLKFMQSVMPTVIYDSAVDINLGD